MTDTQADPIMARVIALEKLVRWLALPFGANRPIFPTEDAYGHPLDESTELADLYDEIVGAPLCEVCGAVPPEPGYRRCRDHW